MGTEMPVCITCHNYNVHVILRSHTSESFWMSCVAGGPTDRVLTTFFGHS